MDWTTARHWKILKATMRYRTATRDYGLLFNKSRGRRKEVEASCKTRAIEESLDADYANDAVEGKSITGGYLMYDGMSV